MLRSGGSVFAAIEAFFFCNGLAEELFGIDDEAFVGALTDLFDLSC